MIGPACTEAPSSSRRKRGSRARGQRAPYPERPLLRQHASESQDLLRMPAVDDTAVAVPRKRDGERRHRLDRIGVPGWLQATPFALVFLVFFIIPLILVVIVSFWDYNDYEMMPAFTTRSYTESFEGCLTQLPDLCTILKTYLSTAKFCLIVWVTDARHRLHRRLFPRLLRALGDDADGAVPGLHDPVLDVERHPDDLLDSAARPQRPRQPRADDAPISSTSRSNGCSIRSSRWRSPSPTCSRSSWSCRSSIR